MDTTTSFLAKEEDIVGDYRFGVYDLLVLPPSFPYGGMVGLFQQYQLAILPTSFPSVSQENACLSFLTPSSYLAS